MKIQTFFEKRPTIGQWKFYPLYNGRIKILMDRKNAQFCEDIELTPANELHSIYEVLMVASMSEEELVESSIVDDDEWKKLVVKFSLKLTDDELRQATSLIQKELELIQERVQEVQAPKTQGKRRKREIKATSKLTG